MMQERNMATHNIVADVEPPVHVRTEPPHLLCMIVCSLVCEAIGFIGLYRLHQLL